MFPEDLARPSPLRLLDATTRSGGVLPVIEDLLADTALFDGLAEAIIAPADLRGAFTALVEGGQAPADLVFCDFGLMQHGVVAEIWESFAGPLGEALRGMDVVLAPHAALLQGAARGKAQVVSATLGGPLLLGRPGIADGPFPDPMALLRWAERHPGRFLYSNPVFTPEGKAFVCGLPHALGDPDPADPETGWPATWQWLRRMAPLVAFHPLRTDDAMAELREGGCDLIAGTTGMDLGGRVTGQVPAATHRHLFDRFRWIPGGTFACVPRHLPPERQRALGVIIASLLSMPAQVAFIGHGQAWPGFARLGVTADLLTDAQRRLLIPYRTAERLLAMARDPVALPLLAEPQRAMERIWSGMIGPRGMPPR